MKKIRKHLSEESIRIHIKKVFAGGNMIMFKFVRKNLDGFLKWKKSLEKILSSRIEKNSRNFLLF